MEPWVDLVFENDGASALVQIVDDLLVGDDGDVDLQFNDPFLDNGNVNLQIDAPLLDNGEIDLRIEDLSLDDNKSESGLSANESLPDCGPDPKAEGPESQNAPSTVRLLDEEHVREHGVHTSVQHFQCCNAISLAHADSDHLMFSEGKFAVLYDIGQQVLVTAVDLGFEPYSIACHDDLFAAVGKRNVKIFYLRPESTEGNATTFQLAAHFLVGVNKASNTINGISFGRCGPEWKLLLASQDEYVYVFNVPASRGRSQRAAAGPCPLEKQLFAKEFLSSSLDKPSGYSGAHAMGIAPRDPSQVRGPHNEELQTDVIGSFDLPLNFVVASPDGSFLAVVGDIPCVWVLDHASGYSTSNMASFNLDSKKRRPNFTAYRGCQYAAWNSTSDLLAVSSDTDYLVRVWHVTPPSSPGNPPTAEAVATFHHNFPCLALQFSPVDPLLLYYTEVPDPSSDEHVSGVGALNVADLRRPLDATQTLQVNRFSEACAAAQFAWGSCSERHVTPLECRKAQCTGYSKWQNPFRMFTRGKSRHKITGLAVSRKHGVLLALNGGSDKKVLQFPTLHWNRGTHRLFPEQFKTTAHFVLLAASGTANRSFEASVSSPFRSLPGELVLSIIERAAEPQSAWVPTRSQADRDKAIWKQNLQSRRRP